jgi:hypothetical protein
MAGFLKTGLLSFDEWYISLCIINLLMRELNILYSETENNEVAEKHFSYALNAADSY